jgi:hypothetical protein
LSYIYQAYNLPIVSDIELPALIQIDSTLFTNPIQVVQGIVPNNLKKAPLVEKPFSTFNETEFRYEVPEIGRYYVSDGNYICIEPLSENREEVLLYFYSNCLAAVLFQRNIIPFHLSGVFVEAGKVLLFAAPSRTGKSTTALMLQQKGYPIFTDDTAILYLQDKQVKAVASYPMMRLWQNTFEKQAIYKESDKQMLFAELNKYGFSFHQDFTTGEVEVVGIVFLQHEGTDIKIEKLKPAASMQQLGNNIYRLQWLTGMKKQRLQFTSLTDIAHNLQMWQATRPKDADTFDSFATAIDNQIIKTYG